MGGPTPVGHVAHGRAAALTGFVVELMSKAFGRLPDKVLLPWLPKLITTLREQAAEMVPVLVREAGRTFPGNLAAVDGWTPPWLAAPPEPVTATAVPSGPSAELLAGQAATSRAVAGLLGYDTAMPVVAVGVSGPSEVAELLGDNPSTGEAVAALLAGAA
jgi:hypothetical protein